MRTDFSKVAGWVAFFVAMLMTTVSDNQATDMLYLLGAGTDNVCPDGYVAIWVVSDDLSRAVERVATPSPAPS